MLLVVGVMLVVAETGLAAEETLKQVVVVLIKVSYAQLRPGLERGLHASPRP